MEEVKKEESHATSAAAFVEGGIQDACDDACSICLEIFSESDPSTVTHCKHEFHLQCILEWCQRSSNCPMCWQQISLKDPESQELLEAVEHERRLKLNPTRSAAIIRHPTLGDIELPHLPVGLSDTELEERIIQHLAAAAMERAHRNSRRERSRSRPSSDERSQRFVFSTQPSASRRVRPVSASQVPVGAVSESSLNNETPQVSSLNSSVNSSHTVSSSPASIPMLNNSQGISVDSSSSGQSSMTNQENAGPSDLQSISDTLRSQFSSMSMKYRESFNKTKRGWRERLFSRSTSFSDIGSEVRREVNAGIASIMECLESRESNRSPHALVDTNSVGSSISECNNHVNMSAQSETPSNNNSGALATRLL
ncbi:PREDICTED: E3 ubiquitin-protein ligase RHF2A-like isoform X2 [Ipomoea nil]|uniref:E3 ubiquitin-protein ligase RHF2A-like isoform X2 n=1 Tax=Ipomoea nil TaxID=35883 RepID=UPI000901EF75|nr:PREDICTED: E3 ubiquitin-protein ligase RHF2A-like isoform X2 [Ipomoea nil]